MMTSFFYGFADLCNALFGILPYFGRIIDGLLIFIGFVANFIWIRYMIQHQQEETGFNQ